ncbi:TlpA family protein disulfide reductase, partial [Dysgonomonas reticulitermitis]
TGHLPVSLRLHPICCGVPGVLSRMTLAPIIKRTVLIRRSGQQVLETWVQTSTNDSLLLSDTRHMIDRCGNDIHIRREVTQAIIRLFIKFAKDSLLAELGTEYLTMPLNGQPAPEIVACDSSIVPKLSLIVFYETGCGNCHYELEELKSKYKLLTDNNIRVISIAADADRAVFEETATGLPWADKLCDFKGFDGANFRNYGIVGTPTFILTDGDGIVRGRYAQLKELLKE